MPSVKYCMGAHTFWDNSTSTWTLDDVTMPAGVTNVTTPAHPYASTAGERLQEFDLNSSAHLMDPLDTRSPAPGSDLPPDSTKRWAFVRSMLVRWNTTDPSSDARILGGGSNNYDVRRTPSKTLALYFNGSKIAESSATFSADTWYRIEQWEIFKDSSGTDLATKQHVVRLISGLTTTIVSTVFINANHGSPSSVANGATCDVGENTARGAGAKMWAAGYVNCWEDADDPAGPWRFDWMLPDALGTWGDFNSGTGTNPDFADVDDCASNGVPDDATTTDEKIISAVGTYRQTYGFGSPFYVTSSDLIRCVTCWYRYWFGSGPKGGTLTGYIRMSDGTNNRDVVVSGGTDAFKENGMHASLTPAAGEWTHGDLAGLEGGHRYEASGSWSGNVTVKVTALVMIITYVKSGEDTDALPAPAYSLLYQRRSSMRAALVR